MNCDEMRVLSHAYLDGELDLAKSLEAEAHLKACGDCARAHRGQQALREGLAAAGLYYQAPADLRARVWSAVRKESGGAEPRRRFSWGLLGVPAALLLVAVIASGLLARGQASAREELVARQVLSSSMRSLIAGPLVDVQSSDQHTVKPWFAGKVDFSPVVQDFAGQGFPLAGGRLDYVDNHPAAALVYRHDQHVINLYTWPQAQPADAPVQEDAFQGYHAFHWTQGGMAYWAVSDTDAGELRQFVDLVRGGG